MARFEAEKPIKYRKIIRELDVELPRELTKLQCEAIFGSSRFRHLSRSGELSVIARLANPCNIGKNTPILEIADKMPIPFLSAANSPSKSTRTPGSATFSWLGPGKAEFALTNDAWKERWEALKNGAMMEPLKSGTVWVKAGGVIEMLHMMDCMEELRLKLDGVTFSDKAAYAFPEASKLAAELARACGVSGELEVESFAANFINLFLAAQASAYDPVDRCHVLSPTGIVGGLNTPDRLFCKDIAGAPLGPRRSVAIQGKGYMELKSLVAHQASKWRVFIRALRLLADQGVYMSFDGVTYKTHFTIPDDPIAFNPQVAAKVLQMSEQLKRMNLRDVITTGLDTFVWVQNVPTPPETDPRLLIHPVSSCSNGLLPFFKAMLLLAERPFMPYDELLKIYRLASERKDAPPPPEPCSEISYTFQSTIFDNL